jgi:hypothetical protein
MVSWKVTQVSEVLNAFIRSDDGGGKYFWNLERLLRDYTTRDPRGLSCLHLPTLEPEISLSFIKRSCVTACKALI